MQTPRTSAGAASRLTPQSARPVRPARAARGLGRPFWREVGQALGVVALFLALGLAARPLLLAPELAVGAGADPGVGGAYPALMEQPAPHPSLWLVDGFNVLCAALLGGRDRGEWWTASRRAEVVALAERFEEPDAEIWVVFDGSRDPDKGPGQRVRRAQDGPGRHTIEREPDRYLLESVDPELGLVGPR